MAETRNTSDRLTKHEVKQSSRNMCNINTEDRKMKTELKSLSYATRIDPLSQATLAVPRIVVKESVTYESCFRDCIR